MITKEYLQQELAKRIDGYKRGVETTTDNIIAEMKSILVLVNALPNYEKKYNEAFAWIRDIYPTLTGAAKEDAEHYFPELRESEEERIRKAVVSLVYEMKGTYQSFAKVELDKMVAWLEKQKEQKPAEWSEEDKNYYDTIVRKLEIIGDDCGLSNNQIKFLREHCPLRCLEWGEEDERIMQTMIKEGDLKPSEIAWLKSLRPQPHTISIKDATKFGNLEYERGVKDGRQSEKGRQWKPSEEQMDALKELIDDANRAGWVTPGATELYEQLKKL